MALRRLLACAALATCASRVDAQFPLPKLPSFTIGGVVRSPSGEPLAGAEVRGGGSYAASREDGSFSLRNVPIESVTVSVRRLGFGSAQLVVAPGEVGSRVQLTVVLTPNAVELGRITVEAKAYDSALWDAGFYHRQRVGAGRFLPPDFWAHFAGAGLGSVMRETPRVVVDRVNNQDFALARFGTMLCPMNVFIDGEYARWALPGGQGNQGASLDELLPRGEIQAMEIYPSPTSVPVEFQRAVTVVAQTQTARIPSPNGRLARSSPLDNTMKIDCGAIVIWTKRHAGQAAAGG